MRSAVVQAATDQEVTSRGRKGLFRVSAGDRSDHDLRHRTGVRILSSLHLQGTRAPCHST